MLLNGWVGLVTYGNTVDFVYNVLDGGDYLNSETRDMRDKFFRLIPEKSNYLISIIENIILGLNVHFLKKK